MTAVASLAELQLFKEKFGSDLVLVAIDAPTEQRFERLQKRNRSDAPQSREEFQERDLREIGWGLAELIKSADKILINNGSLESFYEQVRKELRHD